MTDLDDLRREVVDDLDDRLERLRDQFGRVPVRETREANDPEFFAGGIDRVREGWRGDAGALVVDDGRGLLVRHAGAPDRWTLAGGGHEPGESHAETARREVREETGYEVELREVHAARRKTFYDATDPERELEMLTVWFVGDLVGGERSVGDDEILDVEWFGAPPEAVADHVPDWRYSSR